MTEQLVENIQQFKEDLLERLNPEGKSWYANTIVIKTNQSEPVVEAITEALDKAFSEYMELLIPAIVDCSNPINICKYLNSKLSPEDVRYSCIILENVDFKKASVSEYTQMYKDLKWLMISQDIIGYNPHMEIAFMIIDKTKENELPQYESQFVQFIEVNV